MGLHHHTQLGKLLIHSTYTLLRSFIQSRGKTPLSHAFSSQSTYDVRFDNPHHIESIAPNPRVLYDSLTSNEDMKKSYKILMKAVNDLRIQSSSDNTLSAIDRNGCMFNTNIAEMHATRVCLSIDDVEFYKWASENKFACFWYCQDLRHSEILK